MKKVLTVLLIGAMTLTMAACGGKETISTETEQISESEEVYSEFSWPNSDVAKLLPVPESKIGKIDWEASYGFVIYVSETSKEDYDTYVNKCKEKGFDVNYRSGDDFYYADNPEGYHLHLNYEGKNVMFIRIDEPDEQTEISSESESMGNEETVGETTDGEENNSHEAENTEISPEFKEAMDSYEAFFDEYCEFMKKYNNSEDTTSMMADYASYMTSYAETMEKMAAIDEDKLSDAEVMYYAEVSARISQKLLEVAQ